MLLPDSMELRICVPYNSRSTAWASFDGRGRVELKRELFVHLQLVMMLMLMTRGRPYQGHCVKIPIPDCLCREPVLRLVSRNLPDLEVE